jgi:hypothetical protein
MPGVRLHHPTLRNCTYTVVHLGRPYQQPINCGVCLQTHMHKTYHLGLNNDGDVIVSEVIYERLKQVGLDELKDMGIVQDPPPLVVGIGGGPVDTTVISRENGHVKG